MSRWLWVALGVLVGVACAPELAERVDGALLRAATVALGLLGAGAAAAVGRRGAWRVGLGLAGAGAGLGALAVVSLWPGPVLSGPVALQGVVAGAASGPWADVELSRRAGAGTVWSEVAGRVRVRFPEHAPPPGSAVVLRGTAAPVEDLLGALPGAPDPVRAARLGRVRTAVRAAAWAPLGGVERAVDPFEGARHAGVLRALATGDRRGVDDAVWRRLRRTGTAHLLAISGFHVGLVALACAGALRAAARASAALRPVGLSLAWTWPVGALAGGLYAWGAGAPVSAQRAAIAVGVLALGRLAGRPVSGSAALGLAAVAVVVADPAAAATASFQLSFGAVLGMIGITPWLLRWAPPDLPWLLGAVLRGMGASAGATLGALPAAAWWFQEVAPISAVSNLVAGPLVALWVAPCALVAAAGGPVGAAALAVGDLGVSVLLAALAPLELTPWSPAVGPVGAVLLAVGVVWPRRGGLAAALVCLALQEVHPAGLRLTFLDVGQGDATLVELPGGQRWLVDGGPPSERVARWLRRRGVTYLDVVASTHGHPDHTGGLASVLAGIEVGALWIADGEGQQELVEIADREGVPVVVGPAMAWGALPRAAPINDRSLVLAVAEGRRAALLAGDIERVAERRLASTLPAVDVVKVPHHGSRTSSSPAFVAATRPALAVVSAGRGNPFGHPHPTVVAAWQEAGTAVLRTDLHGTVEVLLEEACIWVRTHRAGAGWTAWRALDAAGAPADGAQ